jgi:hypothetical protein
MMMMKRKVQVSLLTIYVIAGLFCLAGFALMSYVIADHAADSAAETGRTAAIAGCNRNQVPRGYLQLRADEFVKTDSGEPSETTALAADYFRIVNCTDTFKTDNAGGTIFLSEPLEDCFIELLRSKGFGRNAENVTTDPQRLHVEYNCT